MSFVQTELLTDRELEACALIKDKYWNISHLPELLPEINHLLLPSCGITLVNFITLRVIGTKGFKYNSGEIHLVEVCQEDIFRVLREVDYSDSVSVTNAVCEFIVPLIKLGLISPACNNDSVKLTPLGKRTIETVIRTLNLARVLNP